MSVLLSEGWRWGERGVGRRAWGAGHRAWSAGHRAQGTGHRAWGAESERRAWGAGRTAQGAGRGTQCMECDSQERDSRRVQLRELLPLLADHVDGALQGVGRRRVQRPLRGAQAAPPVGEARQLLLVVTDARLHVRLHHVHLAARNGTDETMTVSALKRIFCLLLSSRLLIISVAITLSWSWHHRRPVQC